MRKKFISTLLIICMVASLLAPVAATPREVSAESSFTVRTSMPKLNDKNAKYYYSDLNRFWKAEDWPLISNIIKESWTTEKPADMFGGNCTWWAYSRASEVLGEPLTPELRGNAGT